MNRRALTFMSICFTFTIDFSLSVLIYFHTQVRCAIIVPPVTHCFPSPPVRSSSFCSFSSLLISSPAPPWLRLPLLHPLPLHLPPSPSFFILLLLSSSPSSSPSFPPSSSRSTLSTRPPFVSALSSLLLALRPPSHPPPR